MEAKTFWRRVYAGLFGGGYLTIYAKPNRYRSNATVGTNWGVFSRMNLASDEDMPAVRHEIGHAIGLKHEHQRPDRDIYVSGSFTSGSDQAIIDGIFHRLRLTFRLTRIRFWIFDFYIRLPVIQWVSENHARMTAYDYFSIMHYPNPFDKVIRQGSTCRWRTYISFAVISSITSDI